MRGQRRGREGEGQGCTGGGGWQIGGRLVGSHAVSIGSHAVSIGCDAVFKSCPSIHWPDSVKIFSRMGGGGEELPAIGAGPVAVDSRERVPTPRVSTTRIGMQEPHLWL